MLRQAFNNTSAAFVVKYNKKGMSAWAINVDSTGADTGVSINVDDKCNILVAGICKASPMLYNANNLRANNEPTTYTLPVPTSTATFIAKYANNFYKIYGNLTNNEANEVQKTLINVDEYFRPVYAEIQDSAEKDRIIEIPAETTRKNIISICNINISNRISTYTLRKGKTCISPCCIRKSCCTRPS
jgi:hypothetical protein